MTAADPAPELLSRADAVAGVLDLFPSADRQALNCLADLMDKRTTDLAAKLAEAERSNARFGEEHRGLDEALARAEAALVAAQEAMREAAAKFIETQSDQYVSYQTIWRFVDGIRALPIPAARPEGE